MLNELDDRLKNLMERMVNAREEEKGKKETTKYWPHQSLNKYIKDILLSMVFDPLPTIILEINVILY